MHINVSQAIAQQRLQNHQLNCSNLVPCGCGQTTTTKPPAEKQGVEIEAFFYIVVVIVFYATSIVLLLVKYARNDDEEKNLKYQYSEFVKRERFQAPRYKNKLALERTKSLLHSLEANGGLLFNCPVITISDFADGGDSELCTVSGLLGAPFKDTLGNKRKPVNGNLDTNGELLEGNAGTVQGSYSLESAFGCGNIERSASLCALSNDTGIGFGCFEDVRGGMADDSENNFDAKRNYLSEKSYSI